MKEGEREGTHSERRLGGFLAVKPTLTLEKSRIVQSDDVALSAVQWSLKGSGPDGSPVEVRGTATDVLRKQADGTWLFAIDNPWGTGILG